MMQWGWLRKWGLEHALELIATTKKASRRTTIRKADPNLLCNHPCMKFIVDAHEGVHRRNIKSCCDLRNKCYGQVDDKVKHDIILRARLKTICESIWRMWKRTNRVSLEERAAARSCTAATELKNATCCPNPSPPFDHVSLRNCCTIALNNLHT